MGHNSFRATWLGFSIPDRRFLIRRPFIALVTLLALGWLIRSARAIDFIEYGFDLVDTSSGGGALDAYLPHQFWAETEWFWFSAQLRIELSQGSVFQDTLDGTDFMPSCRSSR